MDVTRREFIGRTAAAAAAVTVPGLVSGEGAALKMQTRPFGATGFKASIYTVGTAEIPQNQEAVAALRTLFKGGVNMVDTAPSYMGTRSESTVGEAIQGVRDGLWISTKTLERSSDGAYREIQQSLGRLRCGRIDLLQIHAINDMAALDATLQKGGAVEGIERAVKEGFVRFIGITGHTRPEVILKGIERYPFASVLIPISAMDAHLNDFATEVVPAANKKKIAVVAMKALKGIERAKPGAFDARPFIRYALSQPVATLNLGLRMPAEAAENLETILAFKPMNRDDQRSLEEEVKSVSTASNLWWKNQ